MDPSTTTPASSSSAEASETPSLNRKKYYIHPVTFKVEDEIYRVPRYPFVDASEVFATMFTLPQTSSDKDEGQSDENPIELPSCTKVEFESLLEVLYPNPGFQTPTKLSKEQWIHVLKLSTQWAMDEVRDLALEKILEFKELDWLERVDIARRFKVTEWLMHDYAALIHSWGDIPLEALAKLLGWEMTARLSDLAAKTQIPLTNFHKLDLCDVQPNHPGKKNNAACTYTPKTLKPAETIVFVCSRCNREHRSKVVFRTGIRVPLYGQDVDEAIKAAFPEDFN